MPGTARGKGKKLGRNKVKCAAYKTHQTREKHKIVRIFHSNGRKAADKYATEKGLLAFAQKRLAGFHLRPGVE